MLFLIICRTSIFGLTVIEPCLTASLIFLSLIEAHTSELVRSQFKSHQYFFILFA